MKARKLFRKLTRINAVLVCLSLILGLTSFSPTVSAKTNYKTLAYDKKLETAQDFEKGEFKNVKIKETAEGIELGSSDSETGEYTTPVIQAPFGATHIGLHWKEKVARENLIAAYIRTSNDGENFSEWIKTTVEADEGRDDKKNEEVFAALVGTEKANFAQAKIEFIPIEGISPKLKSLTFTFINSGEESKQITKKLSLAPSSTAEGVGVLKTSPNGQNINVISREDWGADESYRLYPDSSESWPRSYHGTRKIVVHHTAGASSNGVTDLESNKTTVRAIYYYHAVTQDWGDIGYNALVDAAGNVYEGRYGTHGTEIFRSSPTPEQVMTLDVEAGHASSYNSGSFGVSAMGDFTSFDVPTAQLAGLKSVLAYVADSRGINTQGNSDFLRYDGTWHNGLNNVIAHRDVSATACPGDRLYALMTSIKTDVDNLPGMLSNLSGFSATINSVPISGTSVGSGTIDFSWSTFSGASQYQYVLERVFGTPGLPDGEPWENAWLIPENGNMQTTANTSVQVDSDTLQINSNYVFYVRALDANGAPISTTKHVNFKRNSSVLDTEVPQVSVTSPLNGATVKGSITVSANATDNVGVANVEFYANGQLIGSDNSSPYSINWDTTMMADGTVLISAKAYDATGNQGVSNEISVTVNNAVVIDTIAPVAMINNPADGAVISGTIVPVSASASDNIGVTLFELYIDGKKVSTSTTGTLNYNWNIKKISIGVHTLTVKAYDEAGNIGTDTATVTKGGSSRSSVK